jgi:hypothetical protein
LAALLSRLHKMDREHRSAGNKSCIVCWSNGQLHHQ